MSFLLRPSLGGKSALGMAPQSVVKKDKAPSQDLFSFAVFDLPTLRTNLAAYGIYLERTTC